MSKVECKEAISGIVTKALDVVGPDIRSGRINPYDPSSMDQIQGIAMASVSPADAQNINTACSDVTLEDLGKIFEEVAQEIEPIAMGYLPGGHRDLQA